jgi:glycosyltransferase involved in cell wall biosynthesis
VSETGVSAIVIARDEEDRIEACLRSVQWADERIVVVDAATRDATADRARPLATDLIVRPWDGFVASRQFAILRARQPWIFWIDADEQMSAELAASAIRAAHAPRGKAGFRVRRRNSYLGRSMSHGAWSSDVVLRLFRKDAARFDERLVHESVRVDGAVGFLDGTLEHCSYRSLAHHWEKMGVWAGLWAEQAERDGRRAVALDILLRPPARFMKGYFLKAGFLDGTPGLVLAFMDAVYVGTKYSRLLERQRGRRISRRNDE